MIVCLLILERIGHDPRNLSWSGDTNRFSYKHMTALGWDDAKGLGSSGDGNPNHIAVVHKLDNGGIGMSRARKEGDNNAAGAGQAGRGLEDVLRRLAAAASASPSPAPSPAPESPAESSDKEVKKRNKIAWVATALIRGTANDSSRQRHLQSKRLASSSPAALAEILGVPISSLTSPTQSAPATPVEATPEPVAQDDSGRTADEPVKTSNLSVTDYFRQKMREKMLARQAATSAHGEAAPEEPKYSLANVKEEKKVTIGGVGWEGSKMKFEEVKVELAENTASDAGLREEQVQVKVEREEPIVVKVEAGLSEEMDEKAAKRARKEAKRLKRLEGGVKVERLSPTPVEISVVVEDEEARAKREKKERKEEKKRRQSEGGESEKKRKRDEGVEDEVKVKKEKREKKVKQERVD
jgi:Pin2-interacting protein X1